MLATISPVIRRNHVVDVLNPLLALSYQGEALFSAIISRLQEPSQHELMIRLWQEQLRQSIEIEKWIQRYGGSLPKGGVGYVGGAAPLPESLSGSLAAGANHADEMAFAYMSALKSNLPYEIRTALSLFLGQAEMIRRRIHTIDALNRPAHTLS